jgi:hypothetical protein
MLADIVVLIAKFLGLQPQHYCALKSVGSAYDQALRQQFSSFIWSNQILKKWCFFVQDKKRSRALFLREREEFFGNRAPAWVRDQYHPRCMMCHARVITHEGYCMHCSR